MSKTKSSSGHAGTPRAVIKRERRLSWAWLLPMIALGLAGWLGYDAWRERGVAITVHFETGHGLKAGDELRYRGIRVGIVDEVELDADARSVRVDVRLERSAEHIARPGSLFWIVRPEVDLTGVSGLETIVGPRYLAVEPPRRAVSARLQRSFVGLPAPPVVMNVEPGDLEIILESAARDGLTRGAAVTYRDIPVGVVRSVGLSSDGGVVEVRVHVRSAYTDLIREHTRFWATGGVNAEFGITGLALHVDSLESLLTGSIALAVPPASEAGDRVRTGHRFPLVDQPEEAWTEWRPSVAIGHSLLPAGAGLPTPLKARLSWRQGLFRGQRARQGWTLQTYSGLLGPADLLLADEDAREDSSVLEAGGAALPLTTDPLWQHNGLALLAAQAAPTNWPKRDLRAPEVPEDGLLLADPTGSPLSLSAARFVVDQGHWRIDSAISIDQSWHGACFIAREDGAVIGILLVDDEEEAFIAPVTADLLDALATE